MPPSPPDEATVMSPNRTLIANNRNLKHLLEPVSKIEVRTVFESICEDAKMISDNDPAMQSSFELVLYLGLWAVIVYRVANYLYTQYNWRFLAKLMSLFARIITGVEIHPAATIGPGLFIDHGCGVVIGETAVVGRNVILFHGCTLGGTGKECGKRHPTIGDRVVIGAGAKILGNITLGSDVKVGAGSVVVKSAPDNCTIVGVPGRCIPNKTVVQEEPREEHKENLPDVDGQAIRALYKRNIRLENDLEKLRQKLPDYSTVLHHSPEKTESAEVYLKLLMTDGDNMIYADGI
jgi:serine O-acetyltransferase